MSTTVIQQGHVAVLLNPITDKDAREELSEKLYDDKTILEINYEGTLLFSDVNRAKSYSEREFCGDLFVVGKLDEAGRNEFLEQATIAGLHIDVSTIQPYTCIYYNGCDSPRDMMTKAEFLEAA